MNNHISESNSGNTSDRFDRHVHECIQKNNRTAEPYFNIYIFMALKDYSQLLTHESYLHKLGLDTMNAPN